MAPIAIMVQWNVVPTFRGGDVVRGNGCGLAITRSDPVSLECRTKSALPRYVPPAKIGYSSPDIVKDHHVLADIAPRRVHLLAYPLRAEDIG